MKWQDKIYSSLINESPSSEEMTKNLAKFKPGPRKPLRHKDTQTGVVTTTVRKGDTGAAAAALGRGQHTSQSFSQKNLARKRQDSGTQRNWQDRIYESLVEGKTTGACPKATGRKVGMALGGGKGTVRQSVDIQGRVMKRHGPKSAKAYIAGIKQGGAVMKSRSTGKPEFSNRPKKIRKTT